MTTAREFYEKMRVQQTLPELGIRPLFSSEDMIDFAESYYKLRREENRHS